MPDAYISLQGVFLPAERDAALAYYETYRTIVNDLHRWRPEIPPPYERTDYIKFITAMYGERKDPLPKVGPKVGTRR